VAANNVKEGAGTDSAHAVEALTFEVQILHEVVTILLAQATAKTAHEAGTAIVKYMSTDTKEMMDRPEFYRMQAVAVTILQRYFPNGLPVFQLGKNERYQA